MEMHQAQAVCPATRGAADADTFPKLLQQHARLRGQRPAIRQKDLGIWQTWTWAQVAREVRALACGLAAQGLQRGDKVAIVGNNRPRLYWGIAAAQCIGAVPVPMYSDAVAQEMVYVLQDAEVRFAIVEDQEQVDKFIEISAQCPLLVSVIFDDPRGLRHYDQAWLHDFSEILGRGRVFDDEHVGFFDQEVASVHGDDIAIMLYTSGTTGTPKGVMLTYDNMIITGRNSALAEGLDEHDEVLAYLPMAWVGDNLFSYTQSYVCGFCVSCPESPDTVMIDLREIGPSYYFAPPRVYENLLTQVMIRMEDASPTKRRLFHYFMAHAKRVGTRILDGKSVSTYDRWLYHVGELLVYAPLKNVLGFSRLKLAFTAGEAIGPDIFDFYRSLGINIKQLYGSTEATVFVCVQPNGQVKPDTVGVPAKDVEVKISDSGEVIFRGPGVFHSYWKRPDATAETKTVDGWVFTGDAGFFDQDGHLRIIDRAKDVGKLNNGAMFAPKYIENKLKFFQYIKEVVVFGHGFDYATAFINIDMEAVGNWAERNNLGYTGYTDLAGQLPVYEMIRECLKSVNKELAGDPRLGYSQIHRFLILHKELDADDGELTRTRKVRRKFIADKYAPLIVGLYNGAESAFIETKVRFEDGREGAISANLKIWDVRTFPVGEQLSGASA